jgi:RNA polymerase sigma-70 factor (ECF subfamily)
MEMQLEAIYQEFDAQLRRFIFRRVADPDASEDILQDVYLKIHTHISDLRASNRLDSWIYQIARNAIVDYYRRIRPEEELSEEVPAIQAEEPDVESELAASVREMLDCIPEKYKQALILTELDGLTQNETADRLGLSLSGAKSRIQRAREKLKEAFLDCCHFEFDRRGRVIHYESNCCRCTQDPALWDLPG